MLHIGHIRNGVVGEAVYRLLKANGDDPIPVTYMGDIGTHIAKWLWYYNNFVEDSEKEIPTKEVSKWFGNIYLAAGKKLEENEPMVFVRWAKDSLYKYKLIASIHNEKGALAEFLTYLVKLNIDILSIELGKENSDYIHYCELIFEAKEADINRLRVKMESKIKVIELVRTNDAYKN